MRTGADRPRCRFRKMLVMDMLVVHPAYWRRGHGRTLVEWGNRLADIEQIDIGVAAAASGLSVYYRCGFQHRDSVVLSREKGKVYVGFLVRHPQIGRLQKRKADLVWMWRDAIIWSQSKLCSS